MKKILLLTGLISGFVFGQKYPSLETYEKGNSVNSKEKTFEIKKLIVKNDTLKVGDVLKLGQSVDPTKYTTLYMEHYTKKTEAKAFIGMIAPFPIAYRGSEAIIEEILLIKRKEKLSVIINFRVDDIPGFSFYDLSKNNGEIL